MCKDVTTCKDGEYEKALGLYTRSLDLFVKGIEYEKNQSARVRLLPPRRERDSHARSLFAHTRVLSFARLSCFSPFAGSLHPCTPPSRTTFVQYSHAISNQMEDAYQAFKGQGMFPKDV